MGSGINGSSLVKTRMRREKIGWLTYGPTVAVKLVLNAGENVHIPMELKLKTNKQMERSALEILIAYIYSFNEYF